MENKKIELGKEYGFAGYRWVPIKIDEKNQVAVMQSLGVTSGPWPGYSMPQFGNSNYYDKDIAGEDISSYNEATKNLMERIRSVAVDIPDGTGLYLVNTGCLKANNSSLLKDTLCKSVKSWKDVDAKHKFVFTGSYYMDCVYSYDKRIGRYIYQNMECVIAPAFNLDLAKVVIGEGVILFKEFDSPYIVAYDIKWDTDGDPVLDQLPEEIKIPVEVLGDPDEDAISDYLSDQTDFCHDGYQLGLKFRGDIIPYEISWRDNDNILYFQTDPIIMKSSKDSSYVLSFEANVSKRSFSAEVGLDNMVVFVEDRVSSGRKSSDIYLTSKEMSAMKEICFAMVDSIEAAVEQNEIEDSDSDEETVKPRYLDVKVPGGILRARACIDLDYPGMDIEFIPDEKGGNVNAVSLPRVLIEKPVDNGKLRAIVWSDELKEDPTLKVEFL